jgi:hypothetical protein
MAITVSPVANSQTFGAWLTTTNRLVELVSQNVVTADSSNGGSVTTGNSYVNGHFGSQFMYVTDTIGGGNVSSNGVLRILANVAITDGTSNLFIITANSTTSNTRLVSNTITLLPSGTVTIGGANLTVNAVAVEFSGANISFTNSPLSGNITFTSNTTYSGSVIIANGGFGTNGSVLYSNGTGMYWDEIPAIVGNNGIIANADGIFVNANNGLLANSTGVFVTQGTGTVVNATGVHVNSAYIATIDSNTSVFVSNATTTNTFTIGTASFFVSNGNLGIGNSAPAHKLRVDGDISLSGGIHANGSIGTDGQVLQSNGTVAYWADAASGGGSGQFNTGLSNSIGFAANSTMSAAFTAPANSGFRYIVYSIHVTNIGGANTGITGEFEGSTYANISFATTLPLPSDSSVELLKMPKVMQPSDILKLQVDDSTACHATITYETQPGTDLFGVGVDVTADVTYTDLYVASSGDSVLQSLLLTNDDGVNDVKARVVYTDGSDVIQGYYCFDLIVPANSTIEILEQAKYLVSGYKVRVYANVGGRLEAILAGKVI